MFLKEAYYAHKAHYIYLIKNNVKTVILWNNITILKELFSILKIKLFLWKQSWFNSVIVTWSFRNLSNMLILCSRSVPIIINIENNQTMTHFFQYFWMNRMLKINLYHCNIGLHSSFSLWVVDRNRSCSLEKWSKPLRARVLYFFIIHLKWSFKCNYDLIMQFECNANKIQLPFLYPDYVTPYILWLHKPVRLPCSNAPWFIPASDMKKWNEVAERKLKTRRLREVKTEKSQSLL